MITSSDASSLMGKLTTLSRSRLEMTTEFCSRGTAGYMDTVPMIYNCVEVRTRNIRTVNQILDHSRWVQDI